MLEVLDRFQHKIEAIEIWGNQLLLGTFEGILFTYDIPNGGGFNLRDAKKNFAKKPISQLGACQEPPILLSLSDAVISIHDFPNLTFRSTIARSRGAHLFAVDTTRSPVRLCVAIKKRLVLFNWENGDFVETKELQIPDLAKTLSWCGDSICVGFKREYNLLHIQTGNMTELFPTGKSGTPLATVISNELILSRDNVSIFVGFDGKPTRKYGLSWTEMPLALGYAYPYALGVLNRGVEVRTLAQSHEVQVLQIKPRFLAVKDSEIYAAASNQVWKIIPIPILQQIERLVKDRQFDEALSLCECLQDSDNITKAGKIHEIKTLYTYHLFCQEGQYERSMEYFLELDTDPLRVIGLFNLLPKQLKTQFTYPREIPELGGAGLEKAFNALVVYLRQKQLDCSAKSSPDEIEDYNLITDPATIIDTTLLKAYVKLNDPSLSQLLRKSNFCHVKDSEKFLSAHKKWYELVLLYRGKNMHREALDLLLRLGTGPKAGNPLAGPAETISYLKGLGKPQLALILEFSEWVLRVAPEEALSIFTESRTPENSLPTSDVLQQIKSFAPSLVVPFLENAIWKKKETGSEFHNELIFNYLDFILNSKKEGSKQSTTDPIRKKLLAFLESSQLYNPEKMLSRFPFDDLYEERAVLLCRISQHEQALNIYAHKLKNFDMAESYCHRNYNPEKEESRDVYLSLMKVYLKPEESIGSPMIQPALDLFKKHFSKIDTPRALDLLPGSLSIDQIHPILEAVLRYNGQNRRTNQVVKNILKSENLQIREQMIRAKSKVIRIDEDTMCPVCSKRLGESAFAYYPNGKVVHYICRNQIKLDDNLVVPVPKK